MKDFWNSLSQDDKTLFINSYKSMDDIPKVWNITKDKIDENYISENLIRTGVPSKLSVLHIIEWEKTKRVTNN